jgi:hypothetical protein
MLTVVEELGPVVAVVVVGEGVVPVEVDIPVVAVEVARVVVGVELIVIRVEVVAIDVELDVVDVLVLLEIVELDDGHAGMVLIPVVYGAGPTKSPGSTKVDLGVCVKSNEFIMLLVFASLALSDGRLKIVSANLSKDENSYLVWSTQCLAQGEITSVGTLNP